MVRPPGKGKKIAYSILGVPPAMQGRRRTKQDKRILYDNSY